jgi:hypothetical protein
VAKAGLAVSRVQVDIVDAIEGVGVAAAQRQPRQREEAEWAGTIMGEFINGLTQSTCLYYDHDNEASKCV